MALSLADILARLQQPQAPVPGSIRELPEDQRQAVRRQGLLTLAQIIGQAQPGRLGEALSSGLAGREAVRQEGLSYYQDQMRRQQESERRGLYEQADLAGTVGELEEREAMRQRAAAIGEQLRAQVPPDHPLQTAIEAATVEGDLGSLVRIGETIQEAKARAEEKARQEAYIREQGYDPRDPNALEIMQHEAEKQIDSRYRNPGSQATPWASGSGGLYNKFTGEFRPVEEGGEDDTDLRADLFARLTQAQGATPTMEELDRAVDAVKGNLRGFGMQPVDSLMPSSAPPDPDAPRDLKGAPVSATGVGKPPGGNTNDKAIAVLDLVPQEVKLALPEGAYQEVFAEIKRRLASGLSVEDVAKQMIAELAG